MFTEDNTYYECEQCGACMSPHIAILVESYDGKGLTFCCKTCMDKYKCVDEINAYKETMKKCEK